MFRDGSCFCLSNSTVIKHCDEAVLPNSMVMTCYDYHDFSLGSIIYRSLCLGHMLEVMLSDIPMASFMASFMTSPMICRAQVSTPGRLVDALHKGLVRLDKARAQRTGEMRGGASKTWWILRMKWWVCIYYIHYIYTLYIYYIIYIYVYNT